MVVRDDKFEVLVTQDRYKVNNIHTWSNIYSFYHKQLVVFGCHASNILLCNVYSSRIENFCYVDVDVASPVEVPRWPCRNWGGYFQCSCQRSEGRNRHCLRYELVLSK